MEFPNELIYTKDHEWAALEKDNIYTIGITEHAAQALGEIVYVELPHVGKALKAHETFGVIESIKAVSDLYCPITGTVVEAHSDLSISPDTINKSPYKDGWLIKVKLTDESSLKELMKQTEYKTYVDNL